MPPPVSEPKRTVRKIGKTAKEQVESGKTETKSVETGKSQPPALPAALVQQPNLKSQQPQRQSVQPNTNLAVVPNKLGDITNQTDAEDSKTQTVKKVSKF